MSKPTKKVMCIMLALIMTLSLIMPVSAASFKDTQGHWSQASIDRWNEYGVITGDRESFRPDAPVTRAEFASILNNVMKYIEKEENRFTDIELAKWYSDSMIKLHTAGVMEGENGKAFPQRNVTRQEAAVLITKAFKIEKKDMEHIAFTDEMNIADWAKSSVQALVAKKVINGMPDGSFRPQTHLTRAEAVTILDHLMQKLIVKPGEYSNDVAGNLVVNSADVVLKNMKISGDLYIAQGVGEGEVTLNDVEIAGTVYVFGGGEHSIIFNNVDVKGALVVNRYHGKVRILATGSTSVSVTTLETGAILVTKELTGGGFEVVEIPADVVAGHQIVLDGNFNKIVNQSETAQITANGKIKDLVAEANTNIKGKVDVSKVTSASGINATINDKAIQVSDKKENANNENKSSKESHSNDRDNSNSNGGNTDNHNVSVSGISINEKNVSLTTGESRQLTATVVPSNATNRKVMWQVEDGSTDVVTIDGTGLIIAISEGTKTIKAITEDGGKIDQISVIVTHPSLSFSVAKYEGQVIDPSALIDQAIISNSSYISIKEVKKSVYKKNHYEAMIVADKAMAQSKDPAGNYTYITVTLKDNQGAVIRDTAGISVTGSTYAPVFGSELSEPYKEGSFVLKIDAGQPEAIKRINLNVTSNGYADTTLSIIYIPEGTAYLTGIEPVTGDIKIGSQITAGKVHYEGVPVNSSLLYKWLRADSEDGTYAEIIGRTDPVYTLTEEDSGKYIRVEVSADQTAVGGKAISAPFGPVEILLDANAVFAAIEASFIAKNKDQNNIIANLNLMNSMSEFPGAVISWKSSDESIISHDGIVTRDDKDDRFITLTATLSGSASGTREYKVIVRAKGTDHVDLSGFIDPYFADGYPQAYVKDGKISVRFKLNAPAEVYMVVNSLNGHIEPDVQAVMLGSTGKNGRVIDVDEWPYFKIDSSQVNQAIEFDTKATLARSSVRGARVDFVIVDRSKGYQSSTVTSIVFDPETMDALDTRAPFESGTFINKSLDSIFIYYDEPLDLSSTPSSTDFKLNYGTINRVSLYNYNKAGFASSYVKLDVSGVPEVEKYNVRLSYKGKAIQDISDARNQARQYEASEVKYIEEKIEQATISSDRKSMSLTILPGWNTDLSKDSYDVSRFMIDVEGHGSFNPISVRYRGVLTGLRADLKFDKPLPNGVATMKFNTSSFKNWAMDEFFGEIVSQHIKEIPEPEIPSATYSSSEGVLKVAYATDFELNRSLTSAGLVIKVDGLEYPLRGNIVGNYNPSEKNVFSIRLNEKYSWVYKNAVDNGLDVQIKYSKLNGSPDDSHYISDAAGAPVPDFTYVPVTKLP
ncbi:hypothetical protein AZ66_02580 [Paenibacillus sp. E194]|uniref:S-layer homology domain-containing protein n=1 Tax=Paenibacillus sp. E194 TaxID=1458845 RepID=UPI0005C848EF|nr:S-layer homology domain-containing protein [Paenibacillus sp. E194]KJB89320.1 hypothetical protein AZ66_02580 [Paenibacillus sp. E194]